MFMRKEINLYFTFPSFYSLRVGVLKRLVWVMKSMQDLTHAKFMQLA